MVWGWSLSWSFGFELRLELAMEAPDHSISTHVNVSIMEKKGKQFQKQNTT